MNSNKRFNRNEISKILKRAAELEHKNNVDDDSEGLTIEELQQVSKEVGLHPKYIQRALDELNTPTPSVSSNIFGGPFKYYLSNSVGGNIEEDKWEDIVAEIRRIHGGIGKTSKLGNTFEWEQRKQEVGYVQISLSPKKDRTEISINANYNYFARIVAIFTGVGCVPLFMFLANAVTNTPSAEILVFAPILGLIIGVRFYLSSWMKKKRKKYATIFKRIQDILAPPNTGERADSQITIDETDISNLELKSCVQPRQHTN